MQRRLSTAEKGKGLPFSTQEEAPRKARVRATTEVSSNSNRFRQLNLTLIGKVTNPSVQKVWNLLPFFTEMWKSARSPVGSDLGQGLFQFQFEEEADLLAVLEKRPYHYARWMVILQRWEPTISPSFPSLIPFWIKVQGIPLHLWTKETIESIGRDIGIFESLEITPLAVRMRVHVNGRLPLIKSSIIEYDNGDEVTATLVYEKLERHCSQCNRLDHELKDCLEAKAMKKARTLATQDGSTGSYSKVERPRGPTTQGRNHISRDPEQTRRRENYSYERRPPFYEPDRRQEKTTENRHTNRSSSFRRQEWQPKEDLRGRLVSRESHPGREEHSTSRRPRQDTDRDDVQRQSPGRTPSRTKTPIARSPQGSSRSNHRQLEEHNPPDDSRLQAARGSPLRLDKQCLPLEALPKEALKEAIGEVRDYMTQYTCCADPTESAARKERLRQAENLGEIEEVAANMVRTALETMDITHAPAQQQSPQERIHVAQRLGPLSPNQIAEGAIPSPHNRVPATLRLGPVSPPEDERAIADPKNPALGTKRKPGRPPGRKNTQKNPHLQASPKLLLGSTSRKRKVPQSKSSNVRRKLTHETGKSKPTSSKSSLNDHHVEDLPAENSGAQHSDNQLLRNMIPKPSKRKSGFRTRSDLGP